MTENKGASVIVKTNLKLSGSDSPLYCLASTDPTEIETVLLLPVKPVCTNPLNPPAATSNSALSNVGTGNSSYFVPVSWTVPPQRIGCPPENSAYLNLSDHTRTVKTICGTNQTNVQCLYSSGANCAPLGNEDFSSVWIKNEQDIPSSPWTATTLNASSDIKNPSTWGHTLANEQVLSLLTTQCPTENAQNGLRTGTTADELSNVLINIKKENTSDFFSSQSSSVIPPKTVKDTLCFSESIESVVKTETETSCTLSPVVLGVRSEQCSSASAETLVKTESGTTADQPALCDAKAENIFESCSIRLPSTIPGNDVLLVVKTENEDSSIQSSFAVGTENVLGHSSNVASSTVESGSLENIEEFDCASPESSPGFAFKRFGVFGDREHNSLLRRIINDNKPTAAKVLEPLIKYLKGNECLLCGFKSKSNDAYNAKRHLITHLGDKKFECKTCGKLFTAPSRLSSHMLVHTTDIDKCVCGDCGKRFENRSRLKTHLGKVHSKLPGVRTCSICGKQMAARYLKAHYRLHTGEKPYSCSLCGDEFRTSCALRDHSRSHDETRRFPCKVCGKAYNRRGLLRQHMSIHGNTKPFKCDICEKEFNFQSNLAQHKVTHSDSRPHSCETCGMKFKLPHHLRSHKEAQQH